MSFLASRQPTNFRIGTACTRISARTPSVLSPAEHPISSLFNQQVRNATRLRRPLRPYTFTQLVTLSDGSAFLQRTTSPIAVLSSLKDSKNSALWNPSNKKLAFMEDDVAGRLRLFRSRFGRSWDAQTPEEQEVGQSIDISTISRTKNLRSKYRSFLTFLAGRSSESR